MPDENDNKFEIMETSFGSHSLEPDERAKRVLTDDLTKKLDHIPYTKWDPIGGAFISGI